MTEPVAVVGTAALLPGSPTVARFWRNLVTGQDLMTDIPRRRWLIEDHYDADPRAVDKTYGRRGAFLPEVDFDPLRYGIPPNNLSAIDTTQLLALVVAEQVFADCIGKPADPERVGVLIGASSLERMVEASARLQRPVWLRALREHGVGDDVAQAVCDRIAAYYVPWQEETFPGLLTNVIAGRIASRFDLHGANHTTDAACASSLAALYSGIAELSLRRSDLVITGGVDTMNDITMYACFSRTPALSPTGDCRPFAADADGTMLGEGLVLFALKRLTDAERDGDRIYAVIRGVGASSDGRGAAIYAPVAAGQVRALRRAYETAGYGPETVELVEAHGTGTSAGDAAEFTALCEVFDAAGRAGTADRQWCALGSVKSQIGHTKSAAGAAGLLKAVLAVHHKVLPPTIKVDRPHPTFDIDTSPFYLSTVARPWIRPPGTHPRRASVSSFGFGGTNFHVTVEEYPENGRTRMPAGPTELVLLSAGSPEALRARVARLDLGGDLTDLARRTHAEFQPAAEVRLAVVATDTADLATKLAEAMTCVEHGRPPGPHLRTEVATGRTQAGKVGFLFPGQGVQRVGMGGDIAMHVDRARGPWDRAARLDLADVPLHRVVFPPPAFTDAERAGQEARLTATEWAQPALAVHSLALLEVLDSIGVVPDCVAGHSFGELVALHAAGAFDADTLVRLARRRGELMAAAPAGGAMLAVASDRATVAAAIAGRADVWLANHNGPREVVLAGTGPAIDAAAAFLAGEGIGGTRLNVTTAFHSPLVAPASQPLLAYLRQVEVSVPRLPVFGNAGGLEYPADPDAVRERLATQLREPVGFVDVVEAMYAAGVRTFVEVGAGTTLTGLVGRILGDRPHATVALDRRGRHGLTSLQEGLGRLAVRGVAMDLGALMAELAPAGTPAPLSRSAVRVDGGNYGRPYPPTADGPLPAVPVPGPPESTVDEGWLRTIEDVQRQTADAHSVFQRTLADSHMAYLRMAETTLAGLLGSATGVSPTPPPAPIAGAPTRPAPPVEPPPVEPPLVEPVPISPRPVEPPPVDRPEPPSSTLDSDSTDPADADDVGAYLLSVVADRTGYPVEILNLDMALEADLGIDSIKRVEILSAVRNRIGDLRSEELSALTKLRTLREVAERFDGLTRPAAAQPAAVVGGADAAGDLIRRTLIPVAAVPSGLCLPGLRDGVIGVTDDGRGIAPLVAEGLRRHGIRATVVDRVPEDAGGVILLDGLRPAESVEDAIDAQRSALDAARSVAGRMEAEGGAFVVVQDTGGDFGLVSAAATAPGSVRSYQGGLVALARTAAKEWPRAAVKSIDCATAGRPVEAVAGAIVAELVHGAGATEVGLRPDGTRVVPRLVDAPLDASVRPRIGPHSVIVATGGARGVTAAALRLLAVQQRPRLVLLGRTVLSPEAEELSAATDEAGLIRLLARSEPAAPAEVTARARRVLAVREIRDNLAAFERAGSPVRYVPVDVRDAGAMRQALDEVRREWGPITGVVHGAGILADARIGDKTDEQFGRVFRTKVDGLRELLDATAEDPLDVLCAFSSVAAVFGNPGQADYAMANEVLHHVLAAERVARPGCLVRAIAWGPWSGGMVTPALVERFRDNGVPLIDPAAGARAFVAELAGPPDGVLSILTPRGDAELSIPAGTSLVADVIVNDRAYPYLVDHRVGGACVVPVATALDWFISAAAAWRPDRPDMLLRDLRVLDKITLHRLADGGDRLIIRGYEDGPALDLDLGEGDGRPHFRVTAIATAPPPARRWTAPDALEPHENPYDGTTLFHGPTLRAVRGVPAVGRDGAESAISSSRSLGWPAGAGQLDIAAVDGALQLALLWARRAGAGDTLPMAVDEVRLYRNGAVDDQTRCVVQAVSADDSGAVCNAALLDAGGLARVELIGIRLVRRPGS